MERSAILAVAKESRKNLRREDFLDLAMEALGRTGRSRLHLDTLIEAMPVTKGSFYHHFKGKYEFLIALVQHWDETQTQVVIDTIHSAPAGTSAQELLWLLMWTVERKALNRYERFIRSLALEDKLLAGMVADVDHKRTETVRGLFSSMGFKGIELEARTRAFVTTTSQESFLYEETPPEKRELHLRARHAFFVRP